MYNGIIVTDDDQLKTECNEIISKVKDIRIQFFKSLTDLDLNGYYLNYLFVLVTTVDASSRITMSKIQKKSPKLPFILYNHTLALPNLNELSAGTDFKLIVGENRKSVLYNVLYQIKKDYWRAIPFERFGINYELLSSRIKKALSYIQSASISECNITNISMFLDISPGYFSQEFKRETGISYRKFMQMVLNYYEDIIFEQVNLPAKSISQILGYSELSSFSRSFKKRKGVSPTKYRKMIST